MQKVKLIEDKGIYYIEVVNAPDDIIRMRIKLSLSDLAKLNASSSEILNSLQ